MGGGKAPKEYLEEKKMEEIKRHKQRTLKKYFKDKKRNWRGERKMSKECLNCGKIKSKHFVYKFNGNNYYFCEKIREVTFNIKRRLLSGGQDE